MNLALKTETRRLNRNVGICLPKYIVSKKLEFGTSNVSSSLNVRNNLLQETKLFYRNSYGPSVS
jgi:hypothetical protein